MTMDDEHEAMYIPYTCYTPLTVMKKWREMLYIFLSIYNERWNTT